MRTVFLASGSLLVLAIVLGAPADPDQPRNLAELERAFMNPPADARVMMRWWWFGPSVTKPELEREMRAMKEGGIGGFEVQPVYPLALDDPEHGFRNYPYLSEPFLDALTFTGEKAREVGLRMDLTLASGWPYGGPHMPITLAAGRLRVDRVPTGGPSVAIPKIRDGEKMIAAFLALADRRQFSLQEIQQLTEIGKDAVRLPNAPPGSVVLFFIASRTRQMVKRPSAGAEGYVLDHYDRAAIEAHLEHVGVPLLDALATNPPYAVFSDSLEVYNSDWTGGFLEEFQRRRGYDLTPYLLALAVDIGPETAAIRHDWGQTLTELANDNYLTPIRQWAAQHGTKFRSQTYGIPPVELSSNALVDLPEGEGWQWRKFSATRWAASASHLYGRPVTSSETWTWLHSPVFRATPLDMKAEADLHFLVGINQLIGHGWPYSPPEAREPGWRFYAAGAFNQHNPWWPVMPDVMHYLQRVSFLLRQGKSANDVAIYLPTDDAWAGFTLGHDSINQAMDGLIGPVVMPQILDAGYNFDFIDDPAIAAAGVPYRILILPGVERIPLATYQKIVEFARNGGIVIATRHAPSLAPGFRDSEAGTARIRETSRSLFEAKDAAGHLVTDESQLSATLHAALPPDISAPPEIGCVHRKLDFADVYFVVNTSNHPVNSQASFRASYKQGAWLDAFSGSVTTAAGAAKVDLDLAPYESRVLIFSNERVPERPKSPRPAKTLADLSKDWKLTLSGSTFPMNNLHSWTDLEGMRYYSGIGVYEKAFSLPKASGTLLLTFGEGTPVTVEEKRAGTGMRAMLESPIREAAVVYVNGKRAGAIWRPPYELNITGLVHAGENAIRIEVGNLAINELAKGPLPDYKALNARYGERFQAQDMNNLQPLPSGLLGPVRVMEK